MEFIKYEIKKGDTLRSIAEDLQISVKEMLKFHNLNCGVTQQIIENNIPLNVKYIYLEIKDDAESKEEKVVKSVELDARYRCEQSVITYVGGIMVNHIDTKREFLVHKFQKENKSFVKTELVENILKSYPEEMKEAIDLVADIDLLACNLLTSLNAETGKIDKVENHNEVIHKWNIHQEHLKGKYSFLRNQESKKNIQQFIEVNNEIFTHEKKLIDWVNNKMFFDLFFDKYLVTNNNLFDSYKQNLYSQLFDGKPVKFDFRKDIIGETETQVNVRKVGEMIKGSIDMSELEEIYNVKFKPLVKYQFSEFKFSYRENSIYDLENRWITSSDVTIIEEVKNNVRLMISYKLRKIEV